MHICADDQAVRRPLAPPGGITRTRSLIALLNCRNYHPSSVVGVVSWANAWLAEVSLRTYS